MKYGRQIITCKKCGETKPRSEFPSAKKGGSAVLYTCKLCYYAARAAKPKKIKSKRAVENQLGLRVCRKCGITKPLELFPFNHKGNSWRRYRCADCCYERTARNEMRQEMWRQVREGYGNQCACCGQTEPLFLTIDHVNNDGAQMRRNGTHPANGYLFNVWIIENNFPPMLRLLCANCNFGRQRNGGICPHLTEQPSSTIPSGSTSQAIGDGSALHPYPAHAGLLDEDEEIVRTLQ